MEIYFNMAGELSPEEKTKLGICSVLKQAEEEEEGEEGRPFSQFIPLLSTGSPRLHYRLVWLSQKASHRAGGRGGGERSPCSFPRCRQTEDGGRRKEEEEETHSSALRRVLFLISQLLLLFLLLMKSDVPGLGKPVRSGRTCSGFG